MTTFIPDLSPLARGVGFTVGALLFLWGVGGALWHFGVGGWLRRNVLWRFRLSAPFPSESSLPPAQVEGALGDERPSPEEELERGLYTGLVSIDGAKISSGHLIEIGIVGFNGSGRAVCVSTVRGSITAFFKSANGTAEEIELPTPRLLTDRSNTDWMPHQTEFLIVLEQVLRPDMPSKLLSALDHGQILFDLDSLEITMKSCRTDEPMVFARLKLWNGAVLRRALGFSTHKNHKLRVESVVIGQPSLGESND